MRQNEKQVSNILDRAIMGDEEAFSFLYQENVKKIYNYIFYRTGNIDDAEDLTARVFQRALKHMPNYKKTKVPFSAWLYRIAHNLVANWYRDNSKHKRELPIEYHSYIESKVDVPEKQIEKRQEVEKLINAIHLLPGAFDWPVGKGPDRIGANRSTEPCMDVVLPRFGVVDQVHAMGIWHAANARSGSSLVFTRRTEDARVYRVFSCR